MAAPTARIAAIRWDAAAKIALLGVALMAVVGAAVPVGRFALQAVYGVVAQALLLSFDRALPDALIFVLTNVAMAAAALSAGRRVGAVLASQAVSGQVGSASLTVVVAWAAGALGAVAFLAAAGGTWTALTGPWPYQAGNVLFGYLLHIAALVVGPARGVSRYWRAHAYCRACWVWMQRETGGGSFAAQDGPQVLAALSANRFDELRDLPVNERGTPGRSYSLHWWECPSCHAEAYLTCVVEERGQPDVPTLSKQIVGPPVGELRSLVSHRRALSDDVNRRRRSEAATA